LNIMLSSNGASLPLAFAAGQAPRAVGDIQGCIIEPDQQEEISPIGTAGRTCSSLRPVRKHSALKMPNGFSSFTAAGEDTVQCWSSTASSKDMCETLRLTVSSRRLAANSAAEAMYVEALKAVFRLNCMLL